MRCHTVLVVARELAGRRAIERVLAENCRVLAVGDAGHGLGVLALEQVALIIADQRMAGVPGSEFLAHCAERHPDTIRILLTGGSEVEAVTMAINAGQVHYYLTRPWELHQLRLIVRRGLERYEAERERQGIVRQLEHAQASLRRAAEQRSRWLTLAAHELGTPLHVMLNALDLLDALQLSPGAAPVLRVARRNAEWLGRSLAHMTAAARVQSGRIRLRPAPICLRLLWTGLYEEMRERMANRGLTVVAHLRNDLPRVEADQHWLRLALANVLSNAVRFTPDGGTVTVSACSDAGSGQMIVTVRDTGIGIEPDLLGEIFEPFSASGGDPLQHRSGSLEFGVRGLGLGLSIARAIVTLHRGAIAVESQPQLGSCFTIRLPLRFQGVIT